MEKDTKEEIKEILLRIKHWSEKVSESTISRLRQLENDNVIDGEAIMDRYRPLQDCIEDLKEKGMIHYFGKNNE